MRFPTPAAQMTAFMYSTGMAEPVYPMRINKYLAYKQYCTRREADTYIKAGKVRINGHVASLGDKVEENDVVGVAFERRTYSYVAYNKPRGEVTEEIPVAGVLPLGRLDKDSHGLIILTDDGRITDKLLHPDFEHEKEYVVEVQEKLRPDFEQKMSLGVDIGDYTTKPCEVTVTGEKTFSIILKEGKKHQIRRMCEALNYTVVDLERVRIMNIVKGKLAPGAHRPLEGEEKEEFLESLGF